MKYSKDLFQQVFFSCTERTYEFSVALVLLMRAALDKRTIPVEKRGGHQSTVGLGGNPLIANMEYTPAPQRNQPDTTFNLLSFSGILSSLKVLLRACTWGPGGLV